MFIEEDVIKQVAEAYREFEEEPRLRQLKEKLPESISYEQIRCVVADLRK
ncbi:MAG: helix-turn-helix domain-containing protein [Nanoarchaeota archaeon]